MCYGGWRVFKKIPKKFCTSQNGPQNISYLPTKVRKCFVPPLLLPQPRKIHKKYITNYELWQSPTISMLLTLGQNWLIQKCMHVYSVTLLILPCFFKLKNKYIVTTAKDVTLAFLQMMNYTVNCDTVPHIIATKETNYWNYFNERHFRAIKIQFWVPSCLGRSGASLPCEILKYLVFRNTRNASSLRNLTSRFRDF